MDRLLNALDGSVLVYTVLALIPNLLLILWAMARLSREVRLLRAKVSMLENDSDMLDQSLSALSTEFQNVRRQGSRKEGVTPPPVPPTA
jgi:hypothetical protein